MNKERMLKILKKIFILPPVPAFIIAVPSFYLVFYVLTQESVNPIIQYISYILSAYALIISVICIVNIVGYIRKGYKNHPFVRKISSIPIVDNFIKETEFRAEISLYPSLIINLCYAGIKLISGVYFNSVWFGTLAVYYFLLAVMRFLLLYQLRKGSKTRKSELLICRRCGIILLVLDWALTGIIVLVVRKNTGFMYPGMLIYVMAMYTFYAVINAVVKVVKFRKNHNSILTVAKVINLTAALVSMFSLETAMIEQFGTAEDIAFRQIMSATTGTGVSILILGMALMIIVRTTSQMAKEGAV